MSDFYSFRVKGIDGMPDLLAPLRVSVALVVNVASQCGYTPQYAGLERLYRELKGQRFTVIGFPCNQFGGREPGTAEEIQTFCSTNYGVTFPIMEKIEVNGPNRNDIYKELTQLKDDSGHTGDIQWNFEKFVVSADGTKVTRFSPKTTPDDPKVVAAIENGLPK